MPLSGQEKKSNEVEIKKLLPGHMNGENKTHSITNQMDAMEFSVKQDKKFVSVLKM